MSSRSRKLKATSYHFEVQGDERALAVHGGTLVRHRGSLCNHLRKIKPEEAARLIPLENMLVRITQQDVVYRQYRREDHRFYVPDFGVYIVSSRVPR